MTPQQVSAGRILAASRTCLDRGDSARADDYCSALLALFPADADGWHQRGLIALAQNRLPAAETAVRRALELNPKSAAATNSIGVILLRRKQHAEAEAQFRAALALSPGLTEALGNLAELLAVIGRCAEAEPLLRQVLPRRTGAEAANTLFQLAMCLHGRGEGGEAEQLYRRVIEVAPHFDPARNNLGNVLKGRGQLAEAEQCYRAAITLDPAKVMPYNNLAGVVSDQGRADDALAIYEQALQLDPDHPMVNPNRLLTMHYTDAVSAAATWEAHRDWGQRLLARQTAAPSAPPLHFDGRRPLRVGFVSPDFRHHPVGIFLLPLFEALDPARVSAVAYTINGIEDDMTARFRAACTDWRSLQALSDEAAARQVAADGIDVLFELSGYTAGGRLSLFALRPAPLSITWLGYPDTTGLPCIDYRLTDAIADPPGSEAFHAEGLLRMPEGCHCFRPPQEAPPPRLDTRLVAEGVPTFGCFNNLAKYTDAMIAVWSELLHRHPGSRLLLKNGGLRCADMRARVAGKFADHGLRADRIEILPRVDSFTEHLGLYNRVDIALDTYPYTGTTTTCEALWMGVPVVTLAGDRSCARMGASLLSRVGLGDLVATDAQGYLDRASALVADPARVQRLREDLRGTMTGVPLGNPELFARAFEEMLLGIAADTMVRQGAGVIGSS